VPKLSFSQDDNLLGNFKLKNDKLNKAYISEILSKHPWTLIRIDSTCFDSGISSNKVSVKHLLRIKSNGNIESTEAMFTRFEYDEKKRDVLFYNGDNEEYFALFLTRSKGIYFMVIRKNEKDNEDCITISYTFKQLIKNSKSIRSPR
jgi:hypothetical protein